MNILDHDFNFLSFLFGVLFGATLIRYLVRGILFLATFLYLKFSAPAKDWVKNVVYLFNILAALSAVGAGIFQYLEYRHKRDYYQELKNKMEENSINSNSTDSLKNIESN